MASHMSTWLLGLAVILAVAQAQLPSIEASGNDIRVQLPSSGRFQVNGEELASSASVTALNNRISDALDAVTTDVARIQRQVTDLSNDGTDDAILAAVNVLRGMTDNVSSTIDMMYMSQGEALEGIESRVGSLAGYMGVKYNTSACTTLSCNITVYGRGFIVLPDGTANDIYSVSVAVVNRDTTYPCMTTFVAPTYIQCSISNISDPASAQLSTVVNVMENGMPLGFVGTPQTKMVSIQSLGPVVDFGTASAVLNTQSGSQMVFSFPVAISDPDHPSSQLNIQWSSSNQNSLPNNNMAYSTISGRLSLTFTTAGRTTVTVVVTDAVGMSATSSIEMNIVDSFSCGGVVTNMAVERCVINPPDPYWARNTDNCAALIDGNIAWSAPTGRHLSPTDGQITLNLDSEKIVTRVRIRQFPGYEHGDLELHVMDLDVTSSTYGEFTRAVTMGSNAPTDGVTDFDLPEPNRRTNAVRIVSTSAPKNFDWYRFMEIFVIGCNE